MSQQEKSTKLSKTFRVKAQEFLASRKNFGYLEDIMRHFSTGADLTTCLLTLEYIFTSLLKERQMYVEVVPLRPAERTPDYCYKEQLRNIYEECFVKILNHCEGGSQKAQTQALSTALCLLVHEGKYPIEAKGTHEHHIPLNRLKLVLMKVLSNKHTNSHLINKYEELMQYDDLLFFTWKVLPSLTAKSNPNDVYIMNYLLLIEKLPLQPNGQNLIMENDQIFDGATVRKCLNKIWHCVMLWEHTPGTHKQLLIVLLERVLPHLEKPLLMTDFLMDSLDIGGPVSLLALQGIFNLIQVHNIDYPNIFGKLYSMFEPEIFHTKFKARLFYLSDLFLSSSHLPENLVAAFAKRLARLSLIAPSEDIIVICMFIGNLILRHPGLKCLLNRSTGESAASDPYIMEERDPIKSNAIHSSLWEIQTLQNHVLPSVAMAARFINSPLPSVEWDLGKILETTGDDIFDREIRKNGKLIFLAFDRPNGSSLCKGEKIFKYWNL